MDIRNFVYVPINVTFDNYRKLLETTPKIYDALKKCKINPNDTDTRKQLLLTLDEKASSVVLTSIAIIQMAITKIAENSSNDIVNDLHSIKDGLTPTFHDELNTYNKKFAHLTYVEEDNDDEEEATHHDNEQHEHDNDQSDENNQPNYISPDIFGKEINDEFDHEFAAPNKEAVVASTSIANKVINVSSSDEDVEMINIDVSYLNSHT